MGQGALCPVLGLLVFVFLCVGLVVGLSDCRIVGLSDCRVVELFWKWVSAAFGRVLDQAGHKSPTHKSHNPRACPKEKYAGRVKHKHVAWCLEREEHELASRVMLETEHGLQEREKREKSEGWARIRRV